MRIRNSQKNDKAKRRAISQIARRFAASNENTIYAENIVATKHMMRVAMAKAFLGADMLLYFGVAIHP
ncbi:hypothetical protein D3Z48_18095 [Clostridiaceae bacterium]|nr:hypothetical protein [Clostridiaceae bacterium]